MAALGHHQNPSRQGSGGRRQEAIGRMKGAVELGVRWQSEAATPLFPVLAIHAAARRPAKHVSNEIGSQAEATSGAKSGVAGLRPLPPHSKLGPRKYVRYSEGVALSCYRPRFPPTRCALRRTSQRYKGQMVLG